MIVLQIREITITRLANDTDLQSMHHLIAKDKVPEQRILQNSYVKMLPFFSKFGPSLF